MARHTSASLLAAMVQQGSTYSAHTHAVTLEDEGSLSNEQYCRLFRMAWQVLERILKVDYRIPRSPKISEECKDLIRRILVADPSQRLSIKQIQVGKLAAAAADTALQ